MTPETTTRFETLLTEDFFVGPWLIQPRLNLIGQPGAEAVPVEPQLIRVLACLAAQPGAAVARQHLHETIWPDAIVSEKALTGSVSKLRKVFGDNPRQPAIIETISKGGYRLIAPVSRAYSGDSTPAVLPTLEVTPTVAAPWAAPRRLRWPWAVGVGAAGLLALALVLGWPAAPATTPPEPAVRFTSFAGHEINPALSPDGNEVVFAWAGPQHDNWDLYLKQSATDTPLRLTTHPGFDLRPVFSPDGRQLAFTRYTEAVCLVIVRPVLSGPERVVEQCGPGRTSDARAFFTPKIAWSPDGQHLAVTRRPRRDLRPALYLVDIATEEAEQVTFPGPRAYDQDPAFSPDGRFLAFTRSTGNAFEVFVVSLADGTEQQLTHDYRTLMGLDWTADGAHIVFSSARGGPFGLWKVPRTGGSPTWIPAPGWNLKAPALAAQGRQLVYENWLYDDNIWQHDLSQPGTEPQPLLNSTMWDVHPTFSPDGTQIAFTSTRSGFYEIWTANADGSNLLQRTQFGGPQLGLPRWSPDGTALLFAARPEGTADIYRLALDGTRPERLTEHPGNETRPTWHPDGTSFFFASDRRGSWQVWQQDFGTSTAIQHTENGGYGAFAQDGWLYFTRADTSGLWQQPLARGPATRLLDTLPGRGDWGNWHPAPDGFYLLQRGSTQQLMHYAPTSGTLTPVAPITHRLFNNAPTVAFAPQTRHLLFTHLDQSESDLMLIEGFE